MGNITLTDLQKKVLSAGLLALVLVCIFVPFETIYEHKNEHAKAYVGYSFLWSPPNPAVVCLKTFGMRVYGWESTESVVHRAYRSCYSKPILSQIVMSAIAVVLCTGVALLILGLSPRQTKKLSPRIRSPQTPPVRTNSEKKYYSLADLVFSSAGKDFPISSGAGTKASPLIVTEEIDYVGVEYAAAKHIFAKFEEDYDLAEQRLLNIDGRNIDELTFNVKSSGANNWTEQRRFYFDITIGFSRRS